MKTSAIVTVVLATVAITSCLITFPLLFIKVQTFDSQAHSEIELCKIRATDMWKELLEMNSNGDHATIIRLARAASLNQATIKDAPEKQPIAANISEKSPVLKIILEEKLLDREEKKSTERPRRQNSGCCTCQRGPPGPPGEPGKDAEDGLDGPVGEIGAMGEPAQIGYDASSRFPQQCPCESPPGPQGPPGKVGPPGPIGDMGPAGTSGAPGEQGKEGPAGRPGNSGKQGAPGTPGQLGRSNPGGEGPAGPPGPPGKPGNQGPIGPPGQSGEAGQDGSAGERGPNGAVGGPGQPGQVGASGEPGTPGQKGRCEHCPPARLAPGY